MSYRDIERRLKALEAETPEADAGVFVVDLSDGDYTIDGLPVDQAEFTRRAPAGPFYVDIGEDDDAPLN